MNEPGTAGDSALVETVATWRAAGVRFASSTSRADLATRAWAQLQERALAYIEGQAEPATRADELLFASAQPADGTFPLSLAATSLYGWSIAVLRALALDPVRVTEEPVPFWLAVVAMRQLGIPNVGAESGQVLLKTLIEIAAGNTRPGVSEAIQLVSERGLWRGRAAGTGTVLAVRREKTSLTDTWARPPERTFALVVHAAQFRALLENAPRLLQALPQPIVIAWERPGDLASEDFYTQVKLEGHVVNPFWMYEADDPKKLLPAIVNPEGPDAVIDAALRRMA